MKISDEGGGIPRSGMPKVWTYLYTTAKLPASTEDDEMQSDFKAPLAGFGYGLPISRLVQKSGGWRSTRGNEVFIQQDGGDRIRGVEVGFRTTVCTLLWGRPSHHFHGRVQESAQTNANAPKC